MPDEDSRNFLLAEEEGQANKQPELEQQQQANKMAGQFVVEENLWLQQKPCASKAAPAHRSPKMWTRRKNPEWQPRRASVAGCNKEAAHLDQSDQFKLSNRKHSLATNLSENKATSLDRDFCRLHDHDNCSCCANQAEQQVQSSLSLRANCLLTSAGSELTGKYSYGNGNKDTVRQQVATTATATTFSVNRSLDREEARDGIMKSSLDSGNCSNKPPLKQPAGHQSESCNGQHHSSRKSLQLFASQHKQRMFLIYTMAAQRLFDLTSSDDGFEGDAALATVSSDQGKACWRKCNCCLFRLKTTLRRCAEKKSVAVAAAAPASETNKTGSSSGGSLPKRSVEQQQPPQPQQEQLAPIVLNCPSIQNNSERIGRGTSVTSADEPQTISTSNRHCELVESERGHREKQRRPNCFQSQFRQLSAAAIDQQVNPEASSKRTMTRGQTVPTQMNECRRFSSSKMSNKDALGAASLESLIIESWLDDNPRFVRDYFMRKTSRQFIDDWLLVHAKVDSTSQNNLNAPEQESIFDLKLDYHTDHLHTKNTSYLPDNQSMPLSRQRRNVSTNSMSTSSLRHPKKLHGKESSSTGTSTPVRKISATDFESRTGNAFLRPMISTTPDGRPTFLAQAPSFRCASNLSLSSATLNDLHLNRAGQARVINNGLDESLNGGGDDSIENIQRRIESNNKLDKMGGDKEPEDVSSSSSSSFVDSKDEIKLIFELVKNICNDLDMNTVLHKILKNIALLINADKSSLFLVSGSPGDPNRHLVSQLFNVDQESELGQFEGDDLLNNNNINEGANIKIPWGKGLVGFVAESGESVNIENCYNDPRFTNTIDKLTGYTTNHMLCAPIFDFSNEIVGVAQVINKRDGNPFSKLDEVKFKSYLQFCGIVLRNAQAYEYCKLENKRNQVLLDLAKMVFEEQSTIEQVVYRIMLHTQSLLECQRCQVLLIDDGSDDLDQLLQLTNGWPLQNHHQARRQTLNKRPEWRPQCSANNSLDIPADVEINETLVTDQVLKVETISEPHQQASQQPTSNQTKSFSLVFDLECDGNDFVMHNNKQAATQTDHSKLSLNRKFPINIGITGHVAMTGETLNIEDAHECDRFDKSVDEESSFKHKSILCMPIRNGQRQIIGVSQLINKKNGRPFNKNDENLFEAFAIFCGLGIHNTLMYEKVLKIMAKQRVTFEVLSYHATAPLDEAKKLHTKQVPSSFTLNLNSLKFNDFSLDENYMLSACIRFFLDLDLMRRFQIDQLVLCNWILSVQKNYRNVTYHPIVGGTGLKASPVRYHNWRHAFNVAQMMFAILINTQICQALGELETLALMIACLCHDLDHRGTNNSFQIKSASPLAQLYSTSTMEHHHFDQCVMILNSQGNQILAKLSPEEYSRVIVLLEEAILATDLANYFQKRENFFQLVNSGQFEWRTNLKHKSLLRCMLMTACDVAAITKPWKTQKTVADLVMSEFYQQGDIEKHELNIEPIDLMNREKMSKLPEMQIGFIDTICAPIYAAFAKQFPKELTQLLHGCLENRKLWAELAEENKQKMGQQEVVARETTLPDERNFSNFEENRQNQGEGATTTEPGRPTTINNNCLSEVNIHGQLQRPNLMIYHQAIQKSPDNDLTGKSPPAPIKTAKDDKFIEKISCQRKSI